MTTTSAFIEIISCIGIIAWLAATAIFLFYFFYGIAISIRNWFKFKRFLKEEKKNE